MNELSIPALDGYELPASLFPCDDPSAIVVMSPATATPRGYYHRFCSYLAECGAIAVTYDYRGTFEAPDVLRTSKARMRDWGTLDFAGVLEWCERTYPQLPVYAVGHSVGGHVLIETPENHRIRRAVIVASQLAYWKLFSARERYRIWLFMKVLLPLMTRANGYFPGTRAVFGTNLAPGVLYEWSRWCTKPNYFFDDPTMRDVLAAAATLNADVTMIGIKDDPWATPGAICALLAAFTAARITRLELDPRAFGLESIGHMGFFRSAHRETLWPIAARALELTPTASLQRTS